MSTKRCLGYGPFSGCCVNPAGSAHSDLWCQRCDNIRMASLDADMAVLARAFGFERTAKPWQPLPLPDNYPDKRIEQEA